MYVSINLTHMKVMHKHPSHTCVANLAWIEAHQDAYEISSTTAKSFLSDLTDMELKMLYRNITNEETYYGGSYLRAIIAECIDRLPETEANELDAAAQAVYVDKDSPSYRFSLGSRTPARELFLWENEGVRGTRNPEEANVGARNYKRYERHLSATSAPPPAPGTGQRLAAPRPASAPHAANGSAPPRAQGIRATIWSAADTAWEEAGSPTDKATVLSLRKSIMNKLEEQGVKRTSSSNELGNWQKNRIPGIV